MLVQRCVLERQGGIRAQCGHHRLGGQSLTAKHIALYPAGKQSLIKPSVSV